MTKQILSKEYLDSRFSYYQHLGILTHKTRPKHSKVKIGQRADYQSTNGKCVVFVNGRNVSLARIIWIMMTNTDPSRVFHIDNDPSNNIWTNLTLSNPTPPKNKLPIPDDLKENVHLSTRQLAKVYGVSQTMTARWRKEINNVRL